LWHGTANALGSSRSLLQTTKYDTSNLRRVARAASHGPLAPRSIPDAVPGAVLLRFLAALDARILDEIARGARQRPALGQLVRRVAASRRDSGAPDCWADGFTDRDVSLACLTLRPADRRVVRAAAARHVELPRGWPKVPHIPPRGSSVSRPPAERRRWPGRRATASTDCSCDALPAKVVSAIRVGQVTRCGQHDGRRIGAPRRSRRFVLGFILDSFHTKRNFCCRE
jgi:hypothetical protein